MSKPTYSSSRNPITTLVCVLLALQPLSCTTPITLEETKMEESWSNLMKEEYTMVMLYHPEQTQAYEYCMKTMEDLERNFSERVSLHTADMSQGAGLYEYFGVFRDKTQENGFETVKECQWHLYVNGYLIKYHNENHSFESLSFWLEPRLNNTLTAITSAEQFYSLSTSYFAGIYGYYPNRVDPSAEETVTQEPVSELEIARGESEVLNRLQALAAEFPTSPFFYSFDADVNREVKMQKTHSFILIRKFEDGHKSELSEDPLEFTRLKQKIVRYRFPFIMWWNKEVADFIFQEQQNISILIVRKRKNYQLEAAFERISRVYDEQNMRFAILEINGNKVTSSQKKLLSRIEISPKSNIPTIATLLFDNSTQTMSVARCDNTTEKGIKSFFDVQFGFSDTSDCVQNQFLKRGWKYKYVTPVNYDLLNTLLHDTSSSPKTILFYRSHNKADSKLVKRFLSLSKGLYRDNKILSFHLFDSRLNEPPQFLVDNNAEVPGVMFLLPDLIDRDNGDRYLPQYSVLGGPDDLVKEIDRNLILDSLAILKKNTQKKKLE